MCALFNQRRDVGGSEAFTCPSCMLEQQLRGERRPTATRPPSQQPASALPRTAMSDFLETYLFSRLAAERAERARLLRAAGPSEVPGADGLCLRVVSCLDRSVDVQPGFAAAFPGYPSGFKYRSKALVLFQKLDGVDVALFCMYVQEYGADQPAPNARRVYLSYIDSVKYFRPELVSARGSRPEEARWGGWLLGE